MNAWIEYDITTNEILQITKSNNVNKTPETSRQNAAVIPIRNNDLYILLRHGQAFFKIAAGNILKKSNAERDERIEWPLRHAENFNDFETLEIPENVDVRRDRD